MLQFEYPQRVYKLQMPDIKNYKNLEDIRQGFKTKLLSEPESLLSCKRQRCLRLIMRNGNVRSSQGCSLRNVAMGGHPSAVWRPNGTCGVRTEDGRHRSARKTSLCAVYCAESCGRLV